MSVENCNSTTCLILSDVHLYNVGRLYGWLLNITPYSSQVGVIGLYKLDKFSKNGTNIVFNVYINKDKINGWGQ